MDLETARAFYAEEVKFAAHLRTPALAAAFARVERELFLPPGPWHIAGGAGLAVEYWTTADDDPRHVYHNVAIAIDRGRQLNNGQPSSLGAWMDALALRPGDRVLHVGCGTGYYTAVLAEAVGEGGSVAAVEVAPDLAAQARVHLAPLPQVTVLHADGWDVAAGEHDAIFFNAGVTHLNPAWLDALAPRGRLVVPLTVTGPAMPLSSGLMLAVERRDRGLGAHFLSPVSIYPLTSGRSAEAQERLRKALATRRWAAVRSLRRDPHEPDDTCFCHGEDLCLSQLPLA